MSNLLLPEKKIAAWRIGRDRMIIVFSAMLIFAASVCALSLLPSLLIFRSANEAVASAKPAGNLAQDTRDLARAQALLSQLSALAATSSPAAVAADIVGKKPKGITITHLVYTAPSQYVVSGSASGRDAANAYREALASDPRFASVVIPIDSLAGSDSGDFSLTVTSL